jgi:hypothetical protein
VPAGHRAAHAGVRRVRAVFDHLKTGLKAHVASA